MPDYDDLHLAQLPAFNEGISQVDISSGTAFNDDDTSNGLNWERFCDRTAIPDGHVEADGQVGSNCGTSAAVHDPRRWSYAHHGDPRAEGRSLLDPDSSAFVDCGDDATDRRFS